MNVIVFGASRGVGRCLVERALDDGHRVTAAVRNPATMLLEHEHPRVFPSDVTDEAAVLDAERGHHVAFCTVGDDLRGPITLYSAAANNIARAMGAHGMRRLIFLSNFGVMGETAHDLRGKTLLLLARMILRHTLADHRRALERIREQMEEWVVVRPMALTDGPWTGRYRVVRDNLPSKGTRIARADVADFMLQQATADEYPRQVPAIAY